MHSAEPVAIPDALVVDDHPLVARGIAQYLGTHCGCANAQVVNSAAECLAHLSVHGPPALVIIDFWLSGATALALLQQLVHQSPTTRLLVLSGDDDADIQRRVRDAGAHGFLHKQEPPTVFASAVIALRSGGTWFTRPPQPGVVAPSATRLPLRAAELGLTQRQAQILGMMLRGLPNKRIARDLTLAEQTVKEHVTNILARLGVANRIEAINLLRGRQIDP